MYTDDVPSIDGRILSRGGCPVAQTHKERGPRDNGKGVLAKGCFITSDLVRMSDSRELATGNRGFSGSILMFHVRVCSERTVNGK